MYLLIIDILFLTWCVPVRYWCKFSLTTYRLRHLLPILTFSRTSKMNRPLNLPEQLPHPNASSSQAADRGGYLRSSWLNEAPANERKLESMESCRSITLICQFLEERLTEFVEHNGGALSIEDEMERRFMLSFAGLQIILRLNEDGDSVNLKADVMTLQTTNHPVVPYSVASKAMQLNFSLENTRITLVDGHLLVYSSISTSITRDEKKFGQSLFKFVMAALDVKKELNSLPSSRQQQYILKRHASI